MSPQAELAQMPTTIESKLGLFEQILLATDGTVTDLVALYTGEKIRVNKLHQSLECRPAPREFVCTTPTRLLSRRILLAGSRNYLFAESVFVFERFSLSLQEQLLRTETPVGLLWKEARLETFREIVAKKIEPCAEIAEYFNLPPHAEFVSRTYLIHHRDEPLGSITEKWPVGLFGDERLGKSLIAPA
jgi:chorismate-pyruvate lyase